MPKQTTSASSSKIQTASAPGADAIALLRADHAEVKEMFEQYQSLGERAFVAKKKLATRICLELTRHALAEEEIFYPAVRTASKELRDMLDEATVEHASAKSLIAQILAMEPDEPLYDAKLTVLSEQIEHHVEEEEGEMFPKVGNLGLDMAELGDAMQARKAQVTLSDAHAAT